MDGLVLYIFKGPTRLCPRARLFRIAIDWIMSICANEASVNVGQFLFTDIHYAHDVVLFAGDDVQWPSVLESFDTAANTMSLTLTLGKDSCHP